MMRILMIGADLYRWYSCLKGVQIHHHLSTRPQYSHIITHLSSSLGLDTTTHLLCLHSLNLLVRRTKTETHNKLNCNRIDSKGTRLITPSCAPVTTSDQCCQATIINFKLKLCLLSVLNAVSRAILICWSLSSAWAPGCCGFLCQVAEIYESSNWFSKFIDTQIPV